MKYLRDTILTVSAVCKMTMTLCEYNGFVFESKNSNNVWINLTY